MAMYRRGCRMKSSLPAANAHWENNAQATHTMKMEHGFDWNYVYGWMSSCVYCTSCLFACSVRSYASIRTWNSTSWSMAESCADKHGRMTTRFQRQGKSWQSSQYAHQHPQTHNQRIFSSLVKKKRLHSMLRWHYIFINTNCAHPQIPVHACSHAS